MNQTEVIKLEVTITAEKLFSEESSSNYLVQEVLRNRVKSDEGEEDFEFSRRAHEIIEEIHQRYRTVPLEQLALPEDEPILEDFEITKENIKEEDFESFKQKMLTIIFADSRLFFKLIISQGYDLHLTRAVLPTHDLSHCGAIKNLSRNVQLLQLVKTLIEKHYCKDKQIVTHLTPSMIRIASLTPDLPANEEDEEEKTDETTDYNLSSLVKKTQVRFTSEESVM